MAMNSLSLSLVNMSHAQDTSRGLFHHGNLFKILLPKKKNNNGSLSPELLSLLNNFETNLTVSIRELIPKKTNESLTVSWMIQAMESLCNTHKSIKTLVTDLELPFSDMDETLIHTYAEISLKLLELCNAFTSELDHLNHGNLLLKFAFSKMETNNRTSHLESWNKHMDSKMQRIELSSLVESMNHHHVHKKAAEKKKKHSTKEKVLLGALHGAEFKTLYVFNVFASAFSASSKNLFNLNIPKEMENLPWAQALMELQKTINPEIKNTFLSDRSTIIKDLEAVESGVKSLEEGLVLNLVGSLKKSVIELSDSFDLVSKEIRCLVKIVISTRDAMFESLWRKYEEEIGVTLPMMIKSGETCFVSTRNVIKIKNKCK